jgi:hypothetical protein
VLPAPYCHNKPETLAALGTHLRQAAPSPDRNLPIAGYEHLTILAIERYELRHKTASGVTEMLRA